MISNQTAVMAQRRVMLHVLNTTGIILASVIRLYQHSVANQTGYPPKRQDLTGLPWEGGRLGNHLSLPDSFRNC